MKNFSLPIFACFFIPLAVYFFSGVGISNSVDAPQFYLTKAMVDRHVLNIDQDLTYSWPDVVFVKNHYYSGRSPGESFIGIPFYLLAKAYRGLSRPPYNGAHDGIDGNSGIEASTALMSAFFGSLTVLMVYLISRKISSKTSAVIVALFFAFGSLAWKYSSVFCRHLPGTFFNLVVLYVLVNILLSKKLNWQNLMVFAFGIGASYFAEPSSSIFCLASLIIFIFLCLYDLKIKFTTLILMLFVIIHICLLINIPTFIYNNRIFGSLFSTGWDRQVVNTWLSDKKIAFSTPLFPSIITNFFSPNAAISPSSFSSAFDSSEQLKLSQGYYFALEYPYKGLFVQSPYLLLISLYIFINHRHRRFLFISIFLAFLAILIPLKYLAYYSPNSYDTRYFIPAVAIFTVPLSLVIDKIIGLKKVLHRFLLIVATFALFLYSLFQSWIAVVENYGPHMSGEKRALAADLIQRHNLKIFFQETFPNIYNYKIYLAFSALVLLLWLLGQMVIDSKLLVNSPKSAKHIPN